MSYNQKSSVSSDDIIHCASKRIKLDNHDKNKNEDNLDQAVTSNITNKDSDGDNISVLSNDSEPGEVESESNSNGIRDNYVLGALLNTFFPLQKAHQSDLRLKASQFSDYNATSLKNSYHHVEVKRTAVDVVEYVIDTMYSISNFVNVTDVRQMEACFCNILTANCILMTPALSKPRVGRNHVIELFASMLRSCTDVKCILSDDDVNKVDGVIEITFNHNTECAFSIM